MGNKDVVVEVLGEDAVEVVYVARKQGQADDIRETMLVGPQLAR